MRFLKVTYRFASIVLLGFAVGIFLLTKAVYAGQFYPDGEQRCLKNSGGREEFVSVRYACKEAAEPGHGSGQNACASWLGPPGNPATRKIYLYPKKGDTSVNLYVYGMCTDSDNETGDLYTLFDGGSITGFGKFKRTGPWGKVNSKPVSLDIAKFKAIANTYPVGKSTVYWQIVGLVRSHSDYGSYDYELAWIYLIEGEDVPPPTDLCEAWKPESYSNSNENNGETSIVVKARNTEDRFGYSGSGAWSHGKDEIVWAKPGDNIRWHACYYPGVQKTVDTNVSDIDGTIVNGGTGNWDYTPKPLPSDECLASKPKVGYKKLRPAYDQYIRQYWENQYRVGFDTTYHITQYGWKYYDIGNSDIRQHTAARNMNDGNHSDVGNEIEQKGETGKPTGANINDETPEDQEVKADDGYCCGKEAGSDCCSEAESKAYIKENPDYKDPKNCSRVVCTNSYENKILSAKMTEGPATDSAYVRVPYNYINDTSITIADSPNPVFAGEVAPKVTEVSVTVGEKQNSLTVATYATVVPKVQVKVFMFVSGSSGGSGGGTSSNPKCSDVGGKQCIEIKSNSGSTPSRENVTGTVSFSEFNGTRNAFDASAGDYLCFVSAVWPATSGTDDSLDEKGDNMWKFGSPTCRIIAKRPTFQVWGGSMYSNKGVTIEAPEKRNAYSLSYKKSNISTKFKQKTSTASYKYTPWVEQSLVIYNGYTKMLDSGAGSSAENGRGKNDICKGGVYLTFANACNTTNGVGGNSKIPSGIKNNNRDELFDYWLGDNSGDNGKDKKGKRINLVDNANAGTEVSTGTNAKIRYIYSSGNMGIKESNISAKKTFLVRVKGTLTIKGNIKYTGNYSSIGDVPKVIIYANNVNILCAVEEVDAIIIADGKVNTCSNASSSDDSDSKRSNQLKIVGMVIANGATLGRTYGAAASKSGATVSASKNSGVTAQNSNNVAAEIFDYDSTMLMWEEFMSGSGETDTYETTYTHELAPRY